MPILTNEEIRTRIEQGAVGAVSIDTSIFDKLGNRLLNGLLARLSQFNGTKTRYLLSDVVSREILSHLKDTLKDTIAKNESSARRLAELREDNQLQSQDRLQSTTMADQVEQEAQQLWDKHIVQTGCQIAPAKIFSDFDRLIDMYFLGHAPFEKRRDGKDAKPEFPDAIALITLEQYANRNSTEVIIISGDNGWKKFAEQSVKLIYHDDLAVVLSLFQEDSNFVLDKFIAQTEAGDEQVNNAVWRGVERYVEGLWPWIDADSAFEWESEVNHQALRDMETNFAESFVVSSINGSVTIQTAVEAIIVLECSFSFFVKDGIDRDLVRIGEMSTTKEIDRRIELLITLKVDGSDRVCVEKTEILTKIDAVDFGYIEPDFDIDDL